MSIRQKRDDLFKKEKLEVPEEIKEEFQNDEYDLEEWLEDFE